MGKRKIIEINRDLCNGCGLCTTACAEGALILDQENKAVLVKEIFCDGMGACLDVCPTGALKIVEKDSDDYNATETYNHVVTIRGEAAGKHVYGMGDHEHEDLHLKKEETKMACGCPGSMAKELVRESTTKEGLFPKTAETSELSQWPVQLHLVSPQAPYFNKCDLLVAADCTAFACGQFHQTLLKGKKLVIACPKLDETENYVDKLAKIIASNTIYSVTVAIMEVPCCGGLSRMIDLAVEKSGKSIAVKKIVISIQGEITEK